jgi:esterase/lipase superfamily enzyme
MRFAKDLGWLAACLLAASSVGRETMKSEYIALAIATIISLRSLGYADKPDIAKAYEILISLISDKFDHDSHVVKALDTLESELLPHRMSRFASVLESVKARSDPEVVTAAQSLIDLIKASPDEKERFDYLESEFPRMRQQSQEEGEEQEKVRAVPQTEATVVKVFYATDRSPRSTLDGDVEYGSERSVDGKLQYGKCEISIPKVHKVGKLESPSFVRLEFNADPKRHIVLSQIFSWREERFFELIKVAVNRSASKEAFVFVHGYNVSFENAARRTGQIAFDLNFVGAPIFYSWPSNGKTADYFKDETNITWSTPHLEEFLGLIAQESGAERIHIIAHSMGNRAVCDALKALSYDRTSQLKFNHLVLAAPDIDADTFQELAATLQRLAGRVTLYESSRDKAIHASKKIHGNPRAGEPLLVVPGMDTIDASAIDTDFLGHSYFSETWPLLSDIHSILFKDEPPSGRFGLVEMQHENGKYYVFKP